MKAWWKPKQTAPEQPEPTESGEHDPDGCEQLRDLNMIFIGHGDELERLIAARLKAGGRCVALVTGECPSGKYQGSKEFVWRPPSGTKTKRDRLQYSANAQTFTPVNPVVKDAAPSHGLDMHAIAARLRGKFGDCSARQCCKKGPDIVPLEPGSSYWLATTGSCRLVGLQVRSAAGVVDWEVSGEVVNAISCDGGASRHPATDADTDLRVRVKDPFAKPFAAPTTWPVAIWGLYFLCMQMYIFAAAPVFETSEKPPFWKLPFPLMIMLPFGTTCANTFFGTAFFGDGSHTGSRAINAVVCAMTYSFALLVQPLPGYYLADFLVCALGASALLLVGLPSCCLLTKAQHNLRRGLRWGITVLFGSIGGWLIFYGVILLFLFASSFAPFACMLMMPLATSATEIGLVALSTGMYTNWVYRKRLPGDQATVLSVLVCVLHSYAESARLASTLVSAASTGEYTFFIGATLSIVLNLANRLGWMQRCLSLLADRWGFIRLRNMLCPCAVGRLHGEAKFHFGYIRFITPLAVMGANVANGRQLLFNTPALVCVIYTFVLEILEDGIAHLGLLPYAPTPTMYDELYRTLEILHPNQRYVHTAGQTNSTMAVHVPAIHVTRSDALQLHGMRPLDFMSVGLAMSPTSLFTMCLLQLYMGAGFMAGVCESPISNDKRLEQALLWQRPLSC
eukprot:TRINITY_DN21335_c0_g1_i1.p1 TRINITY_DN21335_c0_g1~~TRINITY_DN21335_c0_g1_i1.p1  ORF type:complete len:679 (+),score=52.67 TRINITY_DN21335_c0_g1_i1:77-2113(+)